MRSRSKRMTVKGSSPARQPNRAAPDARMARVRPFTDVKRLSCCAEGWPAPNTISTRHIQSSVGRDRRLHPEILLSVGDDSTRVLSPCIVLSVSGHEACGSSPPLLAAARAMVLHAPGGRVFLTRGGIGKEVTYRNQGLYERRAPGHMSLVNNQAAASTITWKGCEVLRMDGGFTSTTAHGLWRSTVSIAVPMDGRMARMGAKERAEGPMKGQLDVGWIAGVFERVVMPKIEQGIRAGGFTDRDASEREDAVQDAWVKLWFLAHGEDLRDESAATSDDEGPPTANGPSPILSAEDAVAREAQDGPDRGSFQDLMARAHRDGAWDGVAAYAYTVSYRVALDYQRAAKRQRQRIDARDVDVLADTLGGAAHRPVERHWLARAFAPRPEQEILRRELTQELRTELGRLTALIPLLTRDGTGIGRGKEENRRARQRVMGVVVWIARAQIDGLTEGLPGVAEGAAAMWIRYLLDDTDQLPPGLDEEYTRAAMVLFYPDIEEGTERYKKEVWTLRNRLREGRQELATLYKVHYGHAVTDLGHAFLKRTLKEERHNGHA